MKDDNLIKAVISDRDKGAIVKDFAQPELRLQNEELVISSGCFGLNFTDSIRGLEGGSRVIGMESSGVITDTRLRKISEQMRTGKRVSCIEFGEVGTCIQKRVYPYGCVIPLSDWISDELACTTLKGAFSNYLLFDVFRARIKEFVIVNSAAGGVGSLLSQIASRVGGMNVIGVTSSDSKIDYIKENGIKHVLNWKDEDFVRKVMEITSGVGVSCVFDGVGGGFSVKAIKILRRLGILISFGNASGEEATIGLGDLKRKSLFFTSVRIEDYVCSYPRMVLACYSYQNAVKKGQVKPCITKFNVRDAGDAVMAIRSGKTFGQVVLTV